MEFCLWCYGKGGFRTQVYLWETCSDAQERSGTSKLEWECCILYSTSIDVVFGPLKPRFNRQKDVDFVISNISSIFNDNSSFTNYYFHIEWWIQQLTERNTILSVNIEEISLITKSTSISTCWNYPPVVLRDAKTTSTHSNIAVH